VQGQSQVVESQSAIISSGKSDASSPVTLSRHET
jgi:hypothetical protein